MLVAIDRGTHSRPPGGRKVETTGLRDCWTRSARDPRGPRGPAAVPHPRRTLPWRRIERIGKLPASRYRNRFREISWGRWVAPRWPEAILPATSVDTVRGGLLHVNNTARRLRERSLFSESQPAAA